MFTAPTDLPDDPATLQLILRAALAEIARLQLLIAGLQRNRFGRRSERLDDEALQQGVEESGAVGSRADGQVGGHVTAGARGESRASSCRAVKPKSGSWLNGGSFLRGILQPGVGFTSERGGAAAEVGVLQEVL